MRTIKFRGRDFAGAWWYGYLSSYEGNPVIHPLKCIGTSMLVDEDTVGQFTGLTDKNGKEIYEGDIVRHDENGKCYSIIYEEPMFRFAPNDDCFAFLNHPELLEVIGNVSDNLDLLK